MKGDRIFGLVMMVVALGYLLSASTVQTSFLSDPVGPRVFPYMIGALVMICALVMLLRPDADVEWPGPAMVMTLGAALLALVLYALTIKPLGFILPTMLASGFLSWQISRRPAQAAIAGVGLGIGLYVLFKTVLGLGLQGLPRFLMG